MHISVWCEINQSSPCQRRGILQDVRRDEEVRCVCVCLLTEMGQWASLSNILYQVKSIERNLHK